MSSERERIEQVTTEQWKEIKNFSASENWGNPGMMDFEFIKALDQFRDLAGTPFVVTCGVQGKHVVDSLHYKGQAADLMFPARSKRDLLGLFLLASKIKVFGGIGLYPDWEIHGDRIGGIHLDRRDWGLRATWIGATEMKQRVYRPLTAATLGTYGFL